MKRMDLRRTLRHLCIGPRRTHAQFSPAVRSQIERALRAAEAEHAGELRFVVETALPLSWLWQGRSARERALALFAHLHLWDTHANNGVLIYVLRADRAVEIVADRGISAHVPREEWEAICREAQMHYRAGRFAEGSGAAIQGVARVLARHFPAPQRNASDLPNQPVLL